MKSETTRGVAETIGIVVARFAVAYGTEHWHPGGDPISTLIETVLSQNTSDINSRRAFLSLRRAFPSWEDVASADSSSISNAIREGGLAQIKGLRIKQLLNKIKDLRGHLSLDFLRELSVAEAGAWLKALPGVGDKTAACVLLFSLGKPVLPVDTHILRVSKRLGLIGDRASADEAHIALQRLVPDSLVFDFHVLTIEHGRRTCKSRHPSCTRCAVSDLCPSCCKIS